MATILILLAVWGLGLLGALLLLEHMSVAAKRRSDLANRLIVDPPPLVHPQNDDGDHRV